jgi:hypothetical protein
VASAPAPTTDPAAYLPTEAKPLACEEKRKDENENQVRKTFQVLEGSRLLSSNFLHWNLLTCFSFTLEISSPMKTTNLLWKIAMAFVAGWREGSDETDFENKLFTESSSRHFVGDVSSFSGRSRRKLDAKNNSRFIDVGLREKFVGLIEKLGNGDSENESKLNLNAG